MKLWLQEESETAGDGTLARENEKLMEEAALLCLGCEGIEPPATDDVALSISFVSEEEIRELNREYRGVDSATDVLSFPMMEGMEEIRETLKAREGENEEDGAAGEGEIPLGDVVICTDMIKRQAEEYGHSEKRELIYLFVHSILHLLGYDHEDEEERTLMRAREEEIMQGLGIGR